MKSSKRFIKATVSVVLALLLTVSVLAPLTAMGSENSGGSNGTALGQYRYYSVQAGDTMQSIASKNGITVSDIMTYNNLTADSAVYKGQILKIPLTSKNSSSGLTTSTVTIKAKDAVVKDLVSALAANAGYTVIYKGGNETLSINLENITPLRAIDYITRMVGLSYLKDGNTILVSSPADLNSTFVDSLVLSKFTFKYITYSELIDQANALGLSDMKVVSQSESGRNVWISAYPKEMAKLHELCEILDVEGNVMVGSSASVSNFTPIKMNYISADEFSGLLENLGLHKGIVMTSHPKTLFVFATGQQLSEIMRIKAIVDTADTSTSNKGDKDNTAIVSGSNTIIKLDLVNISKEDAEALIGKTEYAGKVTTYGHDRMLKSIWIMGATADVNAVKAAIENFDSGVVSAASTIHTYEAQNCTVAELMKRIENLDIEEGVAFYQYDHPELTSMIICYCDDVTWNNEVLDALVAADTVDTGSKMWIPIASKTSSNLANDKALLENTVKLMTELYPDLFGGVNIRYETFVLDEPAIDSETGLQAGGTFKTVIYAYTTSDAATRMKNYIAAVDNI
ncbi:MAG: LysM peptidoglycan-binding domain-containing protein [Oscillospiraceae bacterium]|nr:LysM peptidoglycan-binding domain-containing protein [Oscillospiraceae bacterium]